MVITVAHSWSAPPGTVWRGAGPVVANGGPRRERDRHDFAALAGHHQRPARNPANASRSVLVNTGVTGTSSVDGIVAVMGTSGARAETPVLGQPKPQQDNENLTVERSSRLHQVTATATTTARHPHPSADSFRLCHNKIMLG